MVASLPSPSFNGLQLGPLFIHVYGLMYVLAVIAAVALTRRATAIDLADQARWTGVALFAVRNEILGNVRPMLLTLAAAAAAVLLLACEIGIAHV